MKRQIAGVCQESAERPVRSICIKGGDAGAEGLAVTRSPLCPRPRNEIGSKELSGPESRRLSALNAERRRAGETSLRFRGGRSE
jgi:hypothetical protein